MNIRYKFLFTALLFSTVSLFAAQTATSQDKTMFQGFYWDSTPGGVWYDTLATRANGLADIGIDGIWFPPPSKADGQLNVGYTPYDYYDLGEFDSQSGDVTSGTGAFTATRYGTRAGLEAAMQAFQSRGVEVYADIVLNHRSGGMIEKNPYSQYYTDRNGGSLFSPDGDSTFTAFPLTHGSGRINWPVGEGGDFFYPNSVRNPDNTNDFYADNQIAGFHQMYVNSFGYANALHDGDGSNLPLGDSLQVWGDWLSTEIGFDGYRIDFVKGIHPTYMTNWLNYGGTEGTFHVHELYDGSIDRLKTYLNQMSGTTSKAAIFDFNLRFAYKEMSDQGDSYDIRNLLGRGLYYDGVDPEQIVTFVDNHDFDRLDYRGEINQEGHSPIVGSKLPIYAHMMSLPPKATIWFRDYYWYGLQDQLTRLALIRSNFISGGEYTLTAFNDGGGQFQEPFWPGNANEDPRQMMVIQRTGIDNETGAIMAINKSSQYDIDVWVSNQKEDWVGKQLYDISGNHPDTVQVFDDGRVNIKAKANSYSAWVPLDYQIEDDVNLGLSEIEEPSENYFLNDTMSPTVTVRNESLFSQSGVEVSYQITQDDTEIADGTKIVNSIPGNGTRTVSFDSITLDSDGLFDITFTLSFDADSDPSDNTISTSFEVIDPTEQQDFTIDGTINEPAWVQFGQKQNDNLGFGETKDVKALNIYAQDDTLYIGLESALAQLENNGDGIGVMLQFSELEGKAAGTPLGATPGAVHFLNPGDGNIDYTMDFDVDLGISLSWANQRVILSMARYGESVNEGLVVLPATSAPRGNGEMGIGPLNSDGFLPENSVKYAFREGGNPGQGLEIAISKSAIGISEGDVRGFAFIVSGTAYFSNVTLPGTAEGTADEFGNLGFDAEFYERPGGPYVTGWVSLLDFSVEETVPGVVQLLTPVAGEATDVNPELFWAELPTADQYDVEIATDASFSDETMRISTTVADTFYTFQETELGEYFWRVRGVNEAGDGSWSDTETFMISVINSNEENDELPREVVLKQNFPNPFNPSTVIRYELPITGDVRLEVYDMLGRRVATLVDAQKQAGRHEVSFDASDLASGVYMYRLRASGTVLTRQFTLIK